jgi:multidrug efflux pump subunit AcrB
VGQSGIIDFNGMLRGNALKRGSHVAELRVNLSDKHAREKSSIDIVLELREAVSRLARETGANVKLVEDPPGPPVRATILAELYGPDYAQLRKIAEELRDTVFGKTTDVVDIDDSTGDEVREYRVVVNREKAALSGIPLAHVAETLRAFVAGYDAGTVHFEDELEPVAIRIRVPQSERRVAGDLDSMFCVTPQGRQVSLANLTDVVEVTALRAIHHKDQRPVVYVTGELGSTSQVYAVLSMWNHLKANPLPSAVKLTQYFMADPGGAGVSLRWDGEMRLTLDVFRDLGAGKRYSARMWNN